MLRFKLLLKHVRSDYPHTGQTLYICVNKPTMGFHARQNPGIYIFLIFSIFSKWISPNFCMAAWDGTEKMFFTEIYLNGDRIHEKQHDLFRNAYSNDHVS